MRGANIALSCLCAVLLTAQATKDLELVLVTIATEKNDGYHRFMRSAKLYGYSVEVFGLDQQWKGGNMEEGAGGGHKLNILKEALKKYADQTDTLLMFTDCYDVILTAPPSEVVAKFLASKTQMLFSAEDYCWPDRSLSTQYPRVEKGYQFLCSGGYIGYAPAVYELVAMGKIGDTDDDQLYFTKIYLKHMEDKQIKLDHTTEIFQNLNGNSEDLEIAQTANGSAMRIHNKKFETHPVVIHGNGPSKDYLSHLGNYIAQSYSFEEGCLACKEDTFTLQEGKEDEWPVLLVGIFISGPTPFIKAFFELILQQQYPKNKMHIFLHNTEPHHKSLVTSWVNKNKEEYKSIEFHDSSEFLKTEEARNQALRQCDKVGCDQYVSIDACVTLSNRQSFKLLIEQNRTMLTPMLSKAGKLWSNFWGAVGTDGYYKRSPDYIDIVKNRKKGVWNSPYVINLFMMRASVLDKLPVNPYPTDGIDTDIIFSQALRKKGIFMYVTNLDHFGHLKEMETYTTNYKHNDMYQMFDNRLDWEDEYLHPDFLHYLDPTSKQEMPCPDVYWFPFLSENFTTALIEECEYFGKWSGGGHDDKRLAGGYENVPTVDIHMNQIGFEKHWLQMLKDYISPMVTRTFPGYQSYGHSIMNFVVKYTLSGQYFLRPHHDASTFTLNIALNRGGLDKDYQGGGVRFLRYNCTVLGEQLRAGWSLMHPGRLTHYHEGLHLQGGTRYIMISFVDP